MPNIFFPFRNKPIPEPSPELQLLLACTRMEIDQPVANRIRDMASGAIDWKLLRELAHQHRVMPLVYRSLHHTCPELLPSDALHQLRRDFQANAARNIYLMTEFFDILSLIEEKGIQTIPFKGPILAEVSYGNLNLRQFDDLDLFVREEDVLAVRDLLTSNNFTPQHDYIQDSGGDFLRNEGEYNFHSPEKTYFLEIHWQISPRDYLQNLDNKIVWRHSKFTQILEKNILTLSPEFSVIVQALHGMRHLWNRLGWISDLNQLINIENIDWNVVYSIAQEIGAVRILNIGLLLVKDLLRTSLPDVTQPIVNTDKKARGLQQRIQVQYENDNSERPPIIWSLIIRMMARAGLVAKIKYALHRLLSPRLKDVSDNGFITSWKGFFPIVRIARIIRKYVLSPFGTFLQLLQ